MTQTKIRPAQCDLSVDWGFTILGITDGIAAPGETVGRTQIYVDIADGDLKVVFGNGYVATIKKKKGKQLIYKKPGVAIKSDTKFGMIYLDPIFDGFWVS